MPLSILVSILKSVIAWLIIVYVGTNLIGLIGRGLWEKPLDANEYHDFLKKDIKKRNSAGIVTTILSALFTIGICFVIYEYWGMLFLVAFIFVMASRIPGLYWEVRILPKKLGMPYPVPKNLIREVIKNQKTSLGSTLISSLNWIALGIIFIAFLN